jgi:hypothetical protein
LQELTQARPGFFSSRAAGVILDSEIQRLQALGEQFLMAPYPQADREPATGWITDYFSVERALHRIRVVYEAAIAAYSQLVLFWLPKFAPRLRLMAILPARLVGIVVSESQQQLPRNVWYSCRFEPLPRGEQSKVEFRLGTEEEARQLSAPNYTNRDAMRRIRPEAVECMEDFGFGAGLEDICQPDACSRIVYRWLEADLREVKWLS